MSVISNAIHDVERADRDGRAQPLLAVRPDQQLPLDTLSDPAVLQRVERIGCRPSPKQRILSTNNGDESGLERFRMLRHRLQQLRQKRPLSTLLVTSPVPREGKTVVAANLALVLASKSDRVLLVDADLRSSGLRAVLGVPEGPGLAEVLEGRQDLRSTLRYIEPLKFCYLPAGSHASSPTELLQGPRPQALLHALAAAFEWVIVDSPPVNLFADAVSLSTLSDGALLVVRSGFTSKEGLKDAIAALDGTFLAGIVLNAHESPHDTDHYAYYRRQKPAGNSSHPPAEDAEK